MNFIVVGCGRLGAELAYRLYKQKHHIVVIDENETAFDNLPPDFRGRTVIGDVLNKGVLERANITSADGLAAVTSSDQVNAIVVHVAHTFYQVKYLVARNFDPRFFPVLQSFQQHIVNSTSWSAQRIEELLYSNDMHTLISTGNGEVGIYELRISPDLDGHRLDEILPHSVCVPVALTRAGKASIPTYETLLQSDDLLQISATVEGAAIIRKNLQVLRTKEG